MIEVGDTVRKSASRALPQPLSRFEGFLCRLVVVVGVATGISVFVVHFHWDSFTAGLLCPLLFVLLVLLPVALRLVRHRAWTREQCAAPDRPWEWDTEWANGPIELNDPRGEDRQGRPGARTRWIANAAAAALCVFVLASMWSMTGPVGRALLVAGALGLVAFAVYSTMRLRDVRAARLEFSDFPLRAGQPFDVTLGTDEDSGHFDELRFILRCLEERKQIWIPAVTRCEVVFQAVVEIEPGRLPEPGADLVVCIELPADAPGTDFTRRRTRYWEFVVEGAGSLGGFQRTFLAPVYAA